MSGAPVIMATPADVLSYSRERNGTHGRAGYYAGWDNYRGSERKTEALVIGGDPGLVAASERHLKEFASRLPATIRRAPVLDVYGDRPNVPRAIAAMRGGDPRAMMRRTTQTTERAMSRIFVDVGCSAANSEDLMSRRGAAALALVRALATARPVALAAVMCGERMRPLVVHLPSAPLDVARAAAWIGSAELFRRTFAAIDGHGYMPLMEHDMDRGREALGCGPFDIYVPPVHAMGAQAKDPVGWLIEQSKHLINSEEE